MMSLPTLPTALQPDAQTGILTPAQPKRRPKGRESMLRRSGQNGTIVVQSGFYRVRWWLDVEGQKERQNMNVKVAPVVLDKEGKPKPASPGEGNRGAVGGELGAAFQPDSSR